MTRTRMMSALAVAGLLLGGAGAKVTAGWCVGVRVGGPVYYGAWAPYYYPYYPYRAVYVAPPPLVVEGAPVVVQSVPAAAAPPSLTPSVSEVQAVSQGAPAPVASTIVRSPVPEVPQAELQRYLQQLRDPDERVRAETVLQLGRLKALSAVDPLAATLAGDRSPLVREAAARALGLLGSSKALPALQHAALADPDRDVRHSAQFAVDIVQAGH